VVLACLYDVHGNAAALEAVVADARRAGADQWALGGDYALMGPRPGDAVSALRELEGPAIWVRGNTERWLLDPPEDPVIAAAAAWCREGLGDDLTRVLAALPPFALYGESTRVCHGSPVSDMRSFFPDPLPGDAELLDGAQERRVLFGHTHLQFTRHHDAVELVNPGSVGMPFDGDPRAAYALVHDDDRVELRRVAYDHEAVAGELERLATDWSRLAAARVRRARMDA
jgi:diadenosine tetraphosphatase ApaH/serine/threonine PP2A family protein phosphatase